MDSSSAVDVIEIQWRTGRPMKQSHEEETP